MSSEITSPSIGSWDYAEAFARNLGLVNLQEQEKLRRSCVAIPGMGGVGGVHLVTLARLGIGSFRIADPDRFEVANFNRQFGATVSAIGQPKAATMADLVRDVNPDVNLEVFNGPIDRSNIDSFLNGASIVVDGLDYFALDARRLLFSEARRRKLWVVTAGPIGFSTAWLVFSPDGMTFDEYFDLRDGMGPLDQFAAFTVGLCPKATHIPYFDFSQVDRKKGRGPSLGLACNLASGVATAEVAKVLLNRKPLRPAPCYAQFDAYRCLLRRGRLLFGNRNPIQRIKRAILKRQMIKLGFSNS